jgi:hypothetical protein
MIEVSGTFFRRLVFFRISYEGGTRFPAPAEAGRTGAEPSSGPSVRSRGVREGYTALWAMILRRTNQVPPGRFSGTPLPANAVISPGSSTTEFTSDASCCAATR